MPAPLHAVPSHSPAEPLITSRANARVKQLRAAFASPPRLASQGLLALEGHHLVTEALLAKLPLEALFLTPDLPIPPNLPSGTPILRLSPEVFASATDTRAPQGIAALAHAPVHALPTLLTTPNPLLLLCIGLQDPGNVGTLIRSAEAFGASAVLLTPNSVSPWNPKCLRASAGSALRLPLCPVTLADLPTLAQHSIRLIATVPSSHPGAQPLTSAPLEGSVGLLIGHEGQGLPPDWLALAHTTLTIPTPGPTESLNAAVAAAITLYEAARQRAPQSRPQPTP